MSHKKIGRWLKIIIILMGLLAFSISAILSLMLIVSDAPEIEAIRIPWMAFLWSTEIPVVPAVIFSFLTARLIGKGRPFCTENSKYLHRIAVCSGIDAAWVFIGNIIMLFLNMSHPSVLLFSMVVVLIGVSIVVAGQGLSVLIKNAAELQEESELTI